MYNTIVQYFKRLRKGFSYDEDDYTFCPESYN